MKFLVDSSVFLHLLLDEERADDAINILSSVERGDAVGFITVMIAEEVSFKLLIAKASEMGVKGFWEFKRRFQKDKNFREKCVEPVNQFMEYLDNLLGLAWVQILPLDWRNAAQIIKMYGLLPSDAIHASIAKRLNLPIATFDFDFKRIPELKTIP